MSGPRTVALDDHTTLIDLQLFGLWGAGAAYLLRGERSCVIDAGTAAEARHLIAALDALGAFPPHYLLLTHSHFDHAQGAPVLCREARRRGQRIEVLAAEQAVARLRDPSWNRVFHPRQRFEPVEPVTPLRDGARLDLGGLELTVLDVAGHCADDLAVHDAAHGAVFVGDALGYRVGPLLLPPFMPPFWDPEGFRAAARRVEALGCERIGLAHFGCLQGAEARRYPAAAVAACEAWWRVFEDAERAAALDDTAGLARRLIDELSLELPEVEVARPAARLLLGALNAARRLVGRPPLGAADLHMKVFLPWLVAGYRGHRGSAETSRA